MQTPSRHGITCRSLPQALPSLQIPDRARCDRRRRHVYLVPSTQVRKDEICRPGTKQQCLWSYTSRNQPPL